LSPFPVGYGFGDKCFLEEFVWYNLVYVNTILDIYPLLGYREGNRGVIVPAARE
tara:strand:+ start:1363 stop:1524 length:162 start_codon:yes stop_codon:yes gene_type:complete